MPEKSVPVRLSAVVVVGLFTSLAVPWAMAWQPAQPAIVLPWSPYCDPSLTAPNPVCVVGPPLPGGTAVVTTTQTMTMGCLPETVFTTQPCSFCLFLLLDKQIAGNLWMQVNPAYPRPIQANVTCKTPPSAVRFTDTSPPLGPGTYVMYSYMYESPCLTAVAEPDAVGLSRFAIN
jgi:hypothetical protein